MLPSGEHLGKRSGSRDAERTRTRAMTSWPTHKLEPSEAQQLARRVGGELRDWGMVGREVADALVPPAPAIIARSYPIVQASPGSEADARHQPIGARLLRGTEQEHALCILGHSAITWCSRSASP